MTEPHRHRFDHLDPVDHGTRFVLVCTCGWRSVPSERGAVVGDDWDRHLGRVEPRP